MHSIFGNVEIFCELKNYNMFTNGYNDGREVAIYVREGLSAEMISFQCEFKESIWCKILTQSCFEAIRTKHQNC